MIELNVKKEPESTWRETDTVGVENGKPSQLIVNVKTEATSSFSNVTVCPEGSEDSTEAWLYGSTDDGETVETTSHTETVGESVDLGEEVLLNENDIQVYEELLNRMRHDAVIQDPIHSREVVNQRRKKINCDLEEEKNCQMLILSDEKVNNGWDSFRFPRNIDDFLETVFTWADNHLNNQNWPQNDIINRCKALPNLLKYSSSKNYIQANLSNLLIMFYERFKKDVNDCTKSADPSSYIREKGTGATVDSLETQDQWSDVIFKLSGNPENLKFGTCCILSVIESYNTPNRLYFGSILGKEQVKVDRIYNTLLTVKLLDFNPTPGDRFALLSLFRANHIYSSADCLFMLDSSQYLQHYYNPDLKSGPSGVQLQLDEKSFVEFECDAIFKAVDTFSLSTPEASPICCIDFREMDRSLRDIAGIVIEILLSMRSVPIEDRWINLDIPALVVCNNEDAINVLHQKFKQADFSIYRIGRSKSPANLNDKIPKIGRSLVKAFSSLKLMEESPEYAKLAESWDFTVEGIFTNDEQEKLYNEIIEVSKIFALRNSSVVLGNIFDICNDTLINSSFCKIPVCLILGASSIPECFTIPLMKYGCEKFVLIDRESIPGTKSLFTRLVTIYEEEPLPVKGAKCCVVTNVKKKPKIPEPPKQSRHKKIEENTKESSSSTTTGYNPDIRKNPRQRMPYCPKPTPANPTANKE